MAPIVISRGTGEVLSAPILTPEQREAAWAAIVKAHAKRHPELFQEPNEAKEGSE